MKKFKKYSFWVSLTSAIVILIQSIGKVFGFEIENDNIENLIMAICGVLVVLGVVIMPNNSKDDVLNGVDKKCEQDKNE